MGKSGLRIAVGLTGLVLLLIGCAAWYDPVALAAKLGVGPLSALGAATLRADLGAFFATAGGLAMAGALRRAPSLLTAPLAMMALALTGRFLALALIPFDSAMVPPMVAEAVMVGIFAAGRLMRPLP